MAKPILPVIDALRNTVQRLEEDSSYQWGHMGSCNCGFLAQEVTQTSRELIHRFAMQGQGDWSEQLNDYCPDSGLPMDVLISKLLEFGFEREDLARLEQLSDPRILKASQSNLPLAFNLRDDVVLYMRTWADILEAEFLSCVSISEIYRSPSKQEAEPNVEERSLV